MPPWKAQGRVPTPAETDMDGQQEKRLQCSVKGHPQYFLSGECTAWQKNY
jgi:hypothetical protein